MKKVYLLPNLMTAFGLACGLFVIFRVCLADMSVERFDVLKITALLLCLGAISDVLDGLLARRLKAESDFGFQFDSLADAITFGVAPSVVILKTLNLDLNTQWGLAVVFASMVFSICAVLRLVRFNIIEMDKRDFEEVADKHFVGLPVPAAAMTAIATNWFLFPENIAFLKNQQEMFSFNFLPVLNSQEHSFIMGISLCFLGYLMVSKWKFPSLKTLNFKVPKFHLAFTTVLLTLFILYGVIHHFPLVMFTLSWTYILLAVGAAISRKILGRNHQALKDFEPEDEL
jgi:CDP-diacylglycerol---serine O-phosphatidyltransferase